MFKQKEVMKFDGAIISRELEELQNEIANNVDGEKHDK